MQNQTRPGTMSVYGNMLICFGGCTTRLQWKDTLLAPLSSGCRSVQLLCWKQFLATCFEKFHSCFSSSFESTCVC